MDVRVRAVLVRDGKLLVSRERRQGRDCLLLPGGRVQDREAVTDALMREVKEETGLDVVPLRLLYVAEVVGGFDAHDLNLIWLVETQDDAARIDDDALIGLGAPATKTIRPAIVDHIAADAAAGWPERPRWLGNVRQPG